MIPKATLHGNGSFPDEAARIQESTQYSSSKGKRYA